VGLWGNLLAQREAEKRRDEMLEGSSKVLPGGAAEVGGDPRCGANAVGRRRRRRGARLHANGYGRYGYGLRNAELAAEAPLRLTARHHVISSSPVQRHMLHVARIRAPHRTKLCFSVESRRI